MILALFADKAKYVDASEQVQANIGWAFLLLVVLALVWALARSEHVRRGLLGLEDPRLFAFLRIGTAAFTIQNFWNLKPYARMLWSDEGIFTLSEARTRYGRAALKGWSEVEGFFDGWGVVRFFWGKNATLSIECSPEFVDAYLWVFFAVLVLFGIGFRTRLTGLIAWVLMLGLYDRNGLYLEGTDTVYRAFWFILLWARTDAAWSVDNWFRVWRERRRAGRSGFDPWLALDRALSWTWLLGWALATCSFLRLTTVWVWTVYAGALAFVAADGWWRGRGGPSTAPLVRYRLVPSFPRYLIMAQVAAIYCTTGLLKTGQVWRNGDALYYALNMDHFYRFEGPTQWMSAHFGTSLFRLSTWVVHAWEVFFPLVLIGIWLDFVHRHRVQPWALAVSKWRLWLGRGALVAMWLVGWRLAGAAYPYLLRVPKKGPPQDPSLGLFNIDIAFLGWIPAIVLLWWALGRYQPKVPALKLGKFEVPSWTIDQGLLRLLIGRRLWLGVGFLFHGSLVAFMNIGMFPWIMLLTYLGFFTARPWLAFLRETIAKFAKGRRFDALEDEALERPEQVALRDEPWWIDPRARDGRVPDGLVAAFLAVPVVLGGMRAIREGYGPFGIGAEGVLADSLPTDELLISAAKLAALTVVVVAALCAVLRRRHPLDEREQLGTGPALARGTLRRAAILALFAWHTSHIFLSVSPNHPVFSWRAKAKAVVRTWASLSHTTQGWKMFAPNPPRSNGFHKTVVVLENGERWDLGNNSFEIRPNPWIWNDRMRKMQRRMTGKGKWYLRYWSSYQCREWALTHDGEVPLEIRNYKLTTRIPDPEKTVGKPWSPRTLKVKRKLVQSHDCDPKGLLSAEQRRRHGMPLSEDDLAREERAIRARERAVAGKRRLWERRKDFGGSGPPDKSRAAEPDEGERTSDR